MNRKGEECLLVWLVKVCIVWVVCDLINKGIVYYLASTEVVNVLIKIVILPSDDNDV
jgi:hypothetical protein